MDASDGYAQALAEMRAGRKSSHWIWYIFPQLDVLGSSSAARFYGIKGLDEACDYLRDPVLRTRYEEITGVVAAHSSGGVPLERLMGSSIDALKLVSSLTLFRAAALQLDLSDPGIAFTDLIGFCDAILQRAAALGRPPCARTITTLGSQP